MRLLSLGKSLALALVSLPVILATALVGLRAPLAVYNTPSRFRFSVGKDISIHPSLLPLTESIEVDFIHRVNTIESRVDHELLIVIS